MGARGSGRFVVGMGVSPVTQLQALLGLADGDPETNPNDPPEPSPTPAKAKSERRK